MDKKSLEAKVEQIKSKKSSIKITPRSLFEAFGFYRRTINNCWHIDKFLADNKLEIEPHYNDVWFDYPCELHLKPQKASRKIKKDAVRRIGEIEQAHIPPLTIAINKSLSEALTIMQMHNYSQLPVMDEDKLYGYISTDTILSSITRGVESKWLRDFVSVDAPTLPIDGLFLEAITTIKKYGFVIILDQDNPTGIVTYDDITSQYYSWAKPFYLIEEIENHVRNLIADKCTQDEIEEVCHKSGSEQVTVDDMTFGNYLQIFKKEECWKKFNFKYVDQLELVKALNAVREIRNAVMHFKTMEVSDERQEILEQTAKYFGIICPTIKS